MADFSVVTSDDFSGVIDVPRRNHGRTTLAPVETGTVERVEAPPAVEEAPASPPAPAAEPGPALEPTEQPVVAQAPATETAKPAEPEPIKQGRDWRIDSYYKQQGELEALRRQMEELRRAQTVSKEPEKPKEPELRAKPVYDSTKYKQYEDYIEDLADFKLEEREIKQKQSQPAPATTPQPAQPTTSIAPHKTFEQEVAESGLTDFFEKAATAQARFSAPDNPLFLNEVNNSPAKIQLAYHFFTHPEDVMKFDALPLATRLKELGKLEDRLLAQKVTAPAPEPVSAPPAIPAVSPAVPSVPTPKPGVSKAPPPMKTLSSAAGSRVDAQRKPEEIAGKAATGDLGEVASAAGWTVNRGRLGKR